MMSKPHLSLLYNHAEIRSFKTQFDNVITFHWQFEYRVNTQYWSHRNDDDNDDDGITKVRMMMTWLTL